MRLPSNMTLPSAIASEGHCLIDADYAGTLQLTAFGPAATRSGWGGPWLGTTATNGTSGAGRTANLGAGIEEISGSIYRTRGRKIIYSTVASGTTSTPSAAG